jgi:hypothetical protein
MLEAAFDRWQENGATSNFGLIVAAASPASAVVFHAAGWPDADGRCEPALARRAVLYAIEQPSSTETINIIVAGLSLLLGPEGRARQQRDAAEVRALGSTPLVVGLLASAGGDAVETMISTIATAPRVLN